MPENISNNKLFSENSPEISLLKRSDGHKLAYMASEGQTPGIVWLGGFKSDMEGTKALALEAWAREQKRAFMRFDYFGHGQSSGNFSEGSISRWREDVLAILDDVVKGPVVLVGSSMGSWLSLLAAQARPERIRGLVLIAPAPDFTEELMWTQFSEEEQKTLLHQGVLKRPTPYDDTPYEITKLLIEDGRHHLLLDKPVLPLTLPVHILHGQHDADVPWAYAVRLLDRLQSDDVAFTLVKNGDHRLSAPGDIERLRQTVDAMCKKVQPAS